MGEFAIGTNPHLTQPTGSTLCDEKIGGTIHLALGNSYVECGGQNVSGLHWDMAHGMRPRSPGGGGEIRADGVVFYRDGAFTL